MGNFPEELDVFTDLGGTSEVASSDPNAIAEAIENTEAWIGAPGKPQSWSTTLMVLLRKHRRNMMVEAVDGSLFVRLGEAVLENTDSTRWALRRNVGDVTLAAGNLDAGSMAVGTYYVYATGAGAATTTPIQFSTDSNAPSAIGTAPYYKLGWFYNSVAAALAVTYAGNIKENGDVPNVVTIGSASGTIHITATAYGTDSLCTIPFVSNGRPLRICGNIQHDTSNNGYKAFAIVDIDGTSYNESEAMSSQNSGADTVMGIISPKLVATGISAGNHTVDIQMKSPQGGYQIIYYWQIAVEEL